MAQAIHEDMADVIVGEAVVDDATGPAARHHAAVAQQSELMRERGLAAVQEQSEIADAELL